MDSRPIGVFDSGLGGLTAVRQLMLELPGENIIYFGDTGRVPYGVRSAETITKYVRQDIQFLLQFDIKAIVIACNTADATARRTVAPDYHVPIFGVAEPSARAAAAATKNERIGLIGTKATIGTRIYERLIHAIRPTAEVYPQACPLLVPLVEDGRIHPGDLVIETVVREYLQPLKEWGCDTLVLGCTHYPLLWDVIAAYMGPEVTLIDSGREAARAVALELARQNLLCGREQGGTCRYYVSDSVDDFSKMASLFLRRPTAGEVTRIDIEAY